MKRAKKDGQRDTIEIEVAIPTPDGDAVATKVMAQVSATWDAASGDYVLDSEAIAELDKIKARHMGLMLPEEIKALRVSLGVSQKEMSRLLQIGEKSYTRWETGRERPSRSMNLLLCVIADGKIDVGYLQDRFSRTYNWRSHFRTEQLDCWKRDKPFTLRLPADVDFRQPECLQENGNASQPAAA